MLSLAGQSELFGTSANLEEDMSSYAEGLIHQLANNLEREGFSPDDVTKLGQYTDLRALRCLVRGNARIIENQGVPIDRTKLFDVVYFLGEGWKIDEQDERSLSLTTLDLMEVRDRSLLLWNDEFQIDGEEKLARLKKMEHKYIRLDARILQTFWEDQSRIPNNWKEKVNGNIRFILFFGTVLMSPFGTRNVLCLFWDDGVWNYTTYGLYGNDYDPGSVALVLLVE